MSCNLKFIGAAFPRTGTMSTKRALEALGVGQVYHMHEVFLHPEYVPFGQEPQVDPFRIGICFLLVMQELWTSRPAFSGKSWQQPFPAQESYFSKETRKNGIKACTQPSTRSSSRRNGLGIRAFNSLKKCSLTGIWMVGLMTRITLSISTASIARM